MMDSIKIPNWDPKITVNGKKYRRKSLGSGFNPWYGTFLAISIHGCRRYSYFLCRRSDKGSVVNRTVIDSPNTARNIIKLYLKWFRNKNSWTIKNAAIIYKAKKTKKLDCNNLSPPSTVRKLDCLTEPSWFLISHSYTPASSSST